MSPDQHSPLIPWGESFLHGVPGEPERTEELTDHALSLDLDLLVDFDQDRDILVAARLTYSRSDPLAVRLTWRPDLASTVTWYLSRATLIMGLWAPAGAGDVLVCPGAGADRGWVLISLGREGEVVVRGRAWRLHRFLKQCQLIVPWGAEAALSTQGSPPHSPSHSALSSAQAMPAIRQPAGVRTSCMDLVPLPVKGAPRSTPDLA